MSEEIAIIIIFLTLSFLLSSCTITMHEANFFFPKKYPALPEFTSGDISMKNIVLQPDKGIFLSGILLSYSGSSDYLIYFYGNGSSVKESFSRLKYLCGHYKLNVACFDYRSYGLSGGKPSFENIMSDALFIYDYVRASYSGSTGRIFIYTQSIGTVSGLEAASQRPIAGLIMEAGFTSGSDAVSHMTDAQPGISKFLVHLQADGYMASYPDPPVKKIKRVNAPLLYVHGTQDDCFPLSMGRELFDAAGSKDKTFCAMEGYKHADMDITKGKYKEETEKFFAKLR